MRPHSSTASTRGMAGGWRGGTGAGGRGSCRAVLAAGAASRAACNASRMSAAGELLVHITPAARTARQEPRPPGEVTSLLLESLPVQQRQHALAVHQLALRQHPEGVFVP